MYLTNKTFYQRYLSKLPQDELFALMENVEILLVQCGKYKLQHPKVLIVLQKKSPQLYAILSLLISHNKLNKKDVKSLKHSIDQHQEHLHFLIQSSTKSLETAVKKQLKSDYPNAEIHSQENEDIGISISGSGYSYQRTLQSDIEKLFRNLPI
jgi:DNA repair ATPase RecN